MSAREDLLQQYKGEIVPQSFRAGFIVLGYVVSWIGAASTLELLNRRTSRNGLFNHFILVTSAVTMGGISIWCMHFIGNRAIILGHDEPELRVNYSSGFTAISFFLPILVLLAAFVAIGANGRVSWWRIGSGGTLAGAAICGMHYLGNASIKNYTCMYEKAHVVGAALIAVFASILALSLFFVFRATWTNSLWKKALSTFLLAGAVSGMHWTAATGTSYRLIHLNESTQLSQIATIIVVICLSVSAAIFMAGSAIYATWAMRRSASKAQQVVLAAAVFDRTGRILVTPDGLLPSEKITDTYVEKTRGDTFSIAHPLFHWMFQASRNWNSVNGMIDGMKNHLARLPKDGHDRKIRLVDGDGQLIDNYDAIFRELFCLAAVSLAHRLKEQLTDVGILWDEILATGVDGLHRIPDPIPDRTLEEGTSDNFIGGRESRVGRQQEYGHGLLMCLVRHLETPHDVDRLEAAGFRFADVHQVSGIIGSRMQIKTRNLRGKLADMAIFGEESSMMEPGVHLGFFGIKARVGSFGFDILVKKGARNLLPTMPVPLERLESWQMDIIRQFDRMSVPLLLHSLEALKKLSPREVLFASQMSDALEALRAWIDDPVFDDSMLTSKVVQVPCRAQIGSTSAKACTMITMCLMMPIHASASSPRCEFIPLNFFKVHQMVYRDSPHLAAFTRHVHRELSTVINAVPANVPQATYQKAGRLSSRWNRRGPLRHLSRSNDNTYGSVGDGCSTPSKLGRKPSKHDSIHSDSTMGLWNQDLDNRQKLGSDTMSDRTALYQSSSLGGIMVSQEIKVDVRQVEDTNGEPSVPSQAARSTDRVTLVKAGAGFDFEMNSFPGAEEGGRVGGPLGSAVVESEKGNEVITFVDELFAICVDGL
ncbi:hypothetical protein AAE478_006026 [Parahypoxylon ruwenzoriense]